MKLSDLTEGKLDAQPTIRPVVDLTDVEKGYENIGKVFSQGISAPLSYENAQKAIRGSKGTTNADPNGTKDVTAKKLDAVIDERVKNNRDELLEFLKNNSPLQ